MDLTAKVAGLEEEVTVLKGEIKLILQEVRTAILARENTFALASSQGPVEAPARLPALQVQTLPALMSVVQNPPMNREAPEAASALLVVSEPTHPQDQGSSKVTLQTVNERTEPVKPPARLDVPMLAALVSWTQETAARHTGGDLSIVLSLARYSGLIDADLEATLGKIGKTIATPSDKIRAGIGDILLALRQLEALVGSDSKDAQPLRKAG